MTQTELWLYLGVAIFLAVCALAVFGWAMLSDRSRGRKRCPKCWYSMEGLASDEVEARRCPECGAHIRHNRHLYRTRRKWKLAGVSAILLLIASFIAIQPKVQPYGYGSLTPTTCLLFVLQFSDAEWAWRGVHYRMNHDLFHRRRAPDFLDPWDAAIERSMWRWQWRWLGRIALDRWNDGQRTGMTADERRQLRDLLALSRTFARDQQLRDEVMPILLAEMERGDGWYRGITAKMSIEFDDIEGSLARLMELLDDDDARVHSGALHGIRAIALRDDRAVELLLGLLDHELPSIRAGAASALGFVGRRNGPTRAMHDAVLALKHDESCDVQYARITSLANMQLIDQAWRTIEDAIRDEEDICVRRGGLTAAMSKTLRLRGRPPIMPPAILELVVEAIGDEDEAARQFAAWTISHVARDNRQHDSLMLHRDALVPHAEHDDPSVSNAITRALQSIGVSLSPDDERLDQ